MIERPAPTVLDIAEYLGASEQLAGVDRAILSTPLRRPAAVDEAGAGDVTFIDRSRTRGAELLGATSATLVLVGEQLERSDAHGRSSVALVCPNPRLTFIRVVQRFFVPERPAGVHPRAVIEAGARVAASAYVGPFATIGHGASVGERTVIHAGVHVYAGCTIGADCTIHAGTVIGADGFGYERNESGDPEHFPQLGTVVIEDDVEIGANACVDRATLGATVIRSHARIDNLVNIAHNVEVGRGALVVALTMVSGGTQVGERGWISPSAALRDGISIGAGATIGLGAVVLRDVPAGITVAGAPARELEELRALSDAMRELVAARASRR